MESSGRSCAVNLEVRHCAACILARQKGWSTIPARLSHRDKNAVKEVGRLAKGKGLNNIALAASWQTGDGRGAVDLLVDTERAGEAALLVRTHAPSQVGMAVKAWRESWRKKAGRRLEL